MRKIVSTIRSAIDQYNMINEGDKIAVGVSGGKDSVTLLCGLAELKRFYPKKFDLVAIVLDPQFNGKPSDYSQIKELCKRIDVPCYIKKTDLWEIIFKIRNESNPCSLCARMRRGALHDEAKRLNCNKVALGHHLDDAVETFYMNLFNGATIGSFQPISYLSRKDLYLIRPMIFVEEEKIKSFAERTEIPIIKSKCPADGYTERQRIKEFIKNLEQQYPDIKRKTIKAMQKSNITSW